MKRPTPAQTVGPFFHLGMDWYTGPQLNSDEGVTIEGRVLDANGPVSDALLEMWHAGPNGSYDHPQDDQNKPASTTQYFHRVATNRDGEYVLRTLRPGPVQSARFGTLAAHIHVHVFARGLLAHLTTRIYFPEDPHDDDPVMTCVPDGRRSTLIARHHYW